MKTKIYIVLVLLVIVAMIFGGIYLNKKSIDNAYNYAITLIQNGSYEGALSELEKANPDVIDRDDFEWDVRRNTLGKCYKNTVYLYSYALAQLEYNSETQYMTVVHDYLDLIPTDYSGQLSEEIKSFKENFKPQYDEYLAEKERKAEAARTEQQKRDQEYIAGLKNKIPYEGMSEKYINLTAAGNAGKHNSEYVKGWGSNPGYNSDKYYWYANNSNDIVLIVECKDGKKTTSNKNKNDIRTLLNSFVDVNESTNYDDDFSKCTADRNMKGYATALLWSKVFLQGKSFTSFSGSNVAFALLFPMETLFESYVASLMRKQLQGTDYSFCAQDKGYHLFDNPKKFMLRPDIVIKNKIIKTVFVMDTKWKLLSMSKANSGISQADMYQMYAYQKKYNAKNITLLYPKTAENIDEDKLKFISDDGVIVNVKFVDLYDSSSICNILTEIVLEQEQEVCYD